MRSKGSNDDNEMQSVPMIFKEVADEALVNVIPSSRSPYRRLSGAGAK